MEGSSDGIMNHLDTQFSPELSVSENREIAVPVPSTHDLPLCRVFTLSCLRCALRWSGLQRCFSPSIPVSLKDRSSTKVRDLPHAFRQSVYQL